MRRKTIDLGGQPLLDVVSYGRAVGRPFTSGERLRIALTVSRAPEVMLKVSGGARSLKGVEAHLAYIGREGKLAVEMDDGTVQQGASCQKRVVLDWDFGSRSTSSAE